MAKVSLSLEELTKILISNGLLPGEIVRVRVKGQRIHFVIRTSSFILPFIPASLRFLSFEGSHAIFELTVVSSHLDKAVSRFKQLFKLDMPAYMKLEYPKLFVDVEKLLNEKNIRGVRVKDISLEDGELTIVTCSM